MTESSHIAVMGAGMVGASAALGLARLGHEVTLLEPRPPQLQQGSLGIDLRNVALTPASRSFLTSLGVWPNAHLAAYSQMYVWEQWGSGHIHFDAAQMQLDALGWVVEASPLASALWQSCDDHARIHLCLASVESIQTADDRVMLSTDNGLQLQADFVIGADGAQSTLRSLLQVGLHDAPVDQVALATVIRHERPHEHIARQRFALDGPLALLPSRFDDVCSVVWSQSQKSAEHRQQLSDAQFCAEIGQQMEHCLGQVLAVDRRVVFPLHQHRARTMQPHARVLLIGDAMRLIHPLAGLGVNLGFEDVEQLLQVVQGQSDLAAQGLWQRYTRHRETRARAMIATMAAFKQLFGSDLPGAGLVRRLGMQAVAQLPGLKNQIMREAMGLGTLSRSS